MPFYEGRFFLHFLPLLYLICKHEGQKTGQCFHNGMDLSGLMHIHLLLDGSYAFNPSLNGAQISQDLHFACYSSFQTHELPA